MRALYYRNWVGFFILGTITNLPYVVVNSSAKVLATSFDVGNLLPVVMLANVMFGIFAKGGNTLLTQTKCPFGIRFFVNGVLMIIGLLGVAFAPNFWVAVAAIVFAGCSSSFGENLTLGFLSKFPKECINAWSSGTGCAGVTGAILYLALSCTAVSTVAKEQVTIFDPDSQVYADNLRKINRFVFIGVLPSVLLYWLAYFFVVKQPRTEILLDKGMSIGSSGSERTHVKFKEEESDSIQDQSTSLLHSQSDRSGCKLPRACSKVWHCFKLTLWLSFNLGAVYFFEYVCRGFSAKARPLDEYYASELHCPELYASFQLCYQAGVFVSRSSVQMVQIKRVEILTVLQFINMAVWIAQAWWKFLPVYVLPAYMIYVGLLGGASYVNIFYLLRTKDKFADNRELCINTSAMWNTFGIFLGSLFELALFKTIFSDK